MKEIDDFKGDEELKPIPISNTDDPSTESRGVLAIFGVFLALIAGIFGGSRSHTSRESFIYAGMFFAEALICLLISNFMTSVVIQQSSKRIAFFIMISSITCIIAYRLPESIKILL